MEEVGLDTCDTPAWTGSRKSRQAFWLSECPGDLHPRLESPPPPHRLINLIIPTGSSATDGTRTRSVAPHWQHPFKLPPHPPVPHCLFELARPCPPLSVTARQTTTTRSPKTRRSLRQGYSRPCSRLTALTRRTMLPSRRTIRSHIQDSEVRDMARERRREQTRCVGVAVVPRGLV